MNDVIGNQKCPKSGADVCWVTRISTREAPTIALLKVKKTSTFIDSETKRTGRFQQLADHGYTRRARGVWYITRLSPLRFHRGSQFLNESLYALVQACTLEDPKQPKNHFRKSDQQTTKAQS